MDFESKVIGSMGSVMRIRSLRQNVIANNIANADTPNFQARDFSVSEAMGKDSFDGTSMKMVKTNSKHMDLRSADGLAFDLKYRVPYQKTLDGNTVEAQVEANKFSENALRYQASVDFLGGKIKKLKEVLGGNY